MAFPRSSRRMVSCATATVLFMSGTAVALTLSAPEASAAGTALFNQPFHDNTVDGPAGSVGLPLTQTGTNGACLTAAGNATANPPAPCTTSPTDPQGSGTLRLTNDTGGKVGAVFANGTVPTSEGLDITFNLYQYGTATPSGADGTAFVLAAVNPADPVIPSVTAPSGGSLGYSAETSAGPHGLLDGLTDGYAAVGFDEHGNFSNPVYEGSGCTDPPNIDKTMAGQVVLRGPGNGTVGYCALASSAATGSSPPLTLRATTRAASKIPVEVAINPTPSPITTSSGLAVPAGDIGFAFTPVGGSLTTKFSPLPAAPAGLYPSSWVNGNGIPKQLAFGWVASTGGSVDYHEIDSAMVTTLNPEVSTTFAAPPSGEINTAYTDTLTAAGGTAPYTWSVNSGSLPPGMTLSSAGVLAGTPTIAGSYPFTVSVTDQNGGIATTSITLVIAAGPVLNFAAPPYGEIGSTYSDTLAVSGGSGPYTWSVSSGSLPAGITLGSATGTLSGTPTAAGTFPFTVEVTDADGQSATDATSLTVSPSAALSASAASVSFGKTVTFTATVTPAAASGSVTFSDLLSTGPQSGRVVTLGTAVLSGGTAALTVGLPAFNTNTVTATYSGDSSYTSAASGTAGVQVNAYGGEVIINQFRLSGPGGAGDQYAELYNAGPAVSLAGFTLAASSGASITVPSSAAVLGSRRIYLITGAGYSLGARAASDLQAASLGTGGLQVIAPDGPGTVTDAAGPAGASSGFYSGTPLPALSGTPADQYAWVRLEKGGAPVNSGSNAADFQLVSTTGGVVGGIQSCLGSPSPLATGTQTQDNADFQSALLDPAKGVFAPPNFVYVHGTPGLLTVRRTITNTSATAITDAEIRITSLSEVNGPPEPGVTAQPPTPAQLRVINPATPTSQITITGGHTVTVQNLSVGTPATAVPGGGLDTTLAIPLPGGSLAPGASVSFAVSFAVDRHGPYWYSYDVDALAVPASAPGHAPARHSRIRQPAAPRGQLAHPGPPDRYATGHGVLP